jgi:hypothetical protein
MLTIDRIAKTIAGPNDETHIGPDKLRELQDVRWGQLKSQEQLQFLRAADFIEALFEKTHYEMGWVVANAAGDRFRCMGDFADGSGDFVDWTPDLERALVFARRIDAESFARDDEDAWKVFRVGDVPVPFSEPHKRPTGAGTAPAPSLAAPTPEKRATEARCLPVDGAETEDVLRIFRQFVIINATQWRQGAGDPAHPMWEWLVERIEKEAATQGPDWAFVQPSNRKRHSVLVDEYLDLMNSNEAEKRGG